MSLEESKLGYSSQSTLNMEDFIKLFKSQSHWQVPIESFIEAYCLIFTPDEEEIAREEMEERLKIFSDYKKLIMEILADTVMRRHKHAKFSSVLGALGEFFTDDKFLSEQHVFDSLKYLLAVEDFKVFTVFMEDMNIILNDQSQNKVEEEIKRMKAEQKQAKEEALKHMQVAAQTPRHEIELAIKLSLQEEESRKKREQSLQEEEDEALRIAMEQSLQFSKGFNAKDEKPPVDDIQSKSMMIESVPDSFNQSFSRLNQTDFRIKKRGGRPSHQRHVPLVKIQEVSQPSPEKKEVLAKAETLEERRQRLRATRDALFQQKQANMPKPQQLNVSIDSSLTSKEEQERLQRCLKVLKEAADEVFKQPVASEIGDISSINQSVVEDLNESIDANKVSNRFRRARMLNQLVADQSYQRVGEDSSAHILEEGYMQDRSLPLPK